jgi:hypothetical protein
MDELAQVRGPDGVIGTDGKWMEPILDAQAAELGGDPNLLALSPDDEPVALSEGALEANSDRLA